jgi:hypothetical protein
MRVPTITLTNQQPLVPALAQAKARCRRAYDQARRADPRSAVLYDRWLAETLLAADGQPGNLSAEMFRRMAIALEIMADRTGWPHRMRGR